MAKSITVVCTNCQASLKLTEVDGMPTIISCNPKKTVKTSNSDPEVEPNASADTSNNENWFRKMITGSDEDDD
jgi:hypothetical protein